MSWDILIQDFPSSAATVEKIPQDFNPPSLGSRTELITKIQRVAPFSDFPIPHGV